jgi:hypothetical protein
MKNYKLEKLDNAEQRTLNGGVIPLLAYAAAYGTIYAAAHVAAYYKGYSDAGKDMQPCTDDSNTFKYAN